MRTLELCLLWALALGLQWARGDWAGGWSGHPDEASHFLSGVLVHDYVAGHLGESPMPFAERYYDHYPKIAIGHWPPGFYVLQAAWYFLFPPGLLTALWLMAGIVAATGWVIAMEVRRFAPKLALPCAALWLVLPPIRANAEKVMAEPLITLLSLLAAVCFARYLEQPRWRWSLLFGLLASMAILTKGTGVALAAVPPLGVLLTGRLHLLRQWTFWAPAALVALLCLPWYLAVPGAKHERVLPYGGPKWMKRRAPEYFRFLGNLFPFPLWAGIAAAVALVWSRLKQWPFGACALAVVLGNLAGTTGIAVWESRHLVAVGPPLLIVGAYALHWKTASRAETKWLKPAGYAALAGMVGLCLALDAPVDRTLTDQREVVEAVHGRSPVFIAGYADLEGDMISEIAIREKRPGTIVIRADKVMAESNLMGTRFSLHMSKPAELKAYLDQRKVDVIVVDEVRGQWQPEIGATRNFLKEYAAEWEQTPLKTKRATLWRRISGPRN